MTLYSRRTRILDIATDLQPGDLVDISVTDLPCWALVDRIGNCDEDPYGEDACEGDCDGVIFHVDEDVVTGWHAPRTEYVFARLRADADQATIDAENDAHAEHAAARYAGRLAAAAAH